MGYDCTIFEALHEPGGVLIYGIPEFRLPKDGVVHPEVENVKKLGVKIETDVIIGKTLTIDELFEEEGFDAVFIGSGAGLPQFMGIPGENANGVFSANEFLTRNNLMKAFKDGYRTPISRGKKVCVVGGGNVAMDAARTALRLGAEVHIVYRRSEAELPARVEEVHHAKEEGVIFDLLTNPVEILEDEKGWVQGMKVIKMELGEPDASGRRRPVPIEGSEYVIDCDTVIMSLGTSPNPLISNTTKGLDINKKRCIVAQEDNGQTSRDGVYAGGDAVTGAFSGKDCTKVDRSAAYAARYVAKNIVAAGLADQCEIQLSYAIGVAHPTSISINTNGTGKLSDEKLVEIVRENFDLRPTGIIKMLDLRRPIYKQTAAYGHFGRDDLNLPWEQTDKVEVLKKYL